MRVLMWIIIAASANSAPAQVRLPGAQLPVLPTQKLTQAIGQTGSDTLDQLSDLRHLQIADLIRANPRTIAADPHGNPIVRDELLAFSPSARALQAAQARGFRIVREQIFEDLDIHLLVLQPPANIRIAKALRGLRDADPGGTYDFNHIYLGGGSVSSPALPPSRCRRPTMPPAQPAPRRRRARVGLIDSGVDIAHPAFRDAVIHPVGMRGPNSGERTRHRGCLLAHRS